MVDAIDQLVARSKPHKELTAFHNFHRAHPEVLAFIVREIKLRLDAGFQSYSFHSLWQYARWKLELTKGPTDTFQMNDHAAPFYARTIPILWPEFNGRSEFRKSRADECFGLVHEELKQRQGIGYARRLRWASGAALSRGWRPSLPKLIETSVSTKPDIHTR